MPSAQSRCLQHVVAAVALAFVLASPSAAQGVPPGTELVVSDVTDGAPGSRDAVTIAVDLDGSPLANTSIVGTGPATDTPAHVAMTPWGDVLLVDREADPSGLGPDPAGGLGRGGLFRQLERTPDILLSSDGTRCNPVMLGCGASGVFVDPRGIAWSAAGALVVDPESDPSLLGPDRFGGAGHGAVFLVDPNSGGVSLVADGTNVEPGLPIPAFDEPVAAALATDGTLYVVDREADPTGAGWHGAVFAVEVATGHVSLASADATFMDLRDVAVEPSGTLLVLDGLAGGNGQVVRLALAPPPNVVSRVGSPFFADARAIAVAPDGIAYVADAAADPAAIGALGAVLRVDVGAASVTLAASTGDFRDPSGIDVVTSLPSEGCGLSPGGTLRLARDGCDLVLTWMQPAPECSESFRIWRGESARPASDGGGFPNDPAFEDVTPLDADWDPSNGSAVLTDCDGALSLYIVQRVNADASEGPLDAYGQ